MKQIRIRALMGIILVKENAVPAKESARCSFFHQKSHMD
jgi:hypothetical protein